MGASPHGASWACSGLGGLAGFSWFMFVDPDLTWRVFAINFAFGGISLLVAAEIRAVQERGAGRADPDRCLRCFPALNFIVRTVIVMALYGPYTSYDGFYASVYWTTACSRTRCSRC